MKKYNIIEPIYVYLLARLLIIYVLFVLCRAVFYWYNIDFFPETTTSHFLSMLWYGLKFDTVSIIYINSLFIVMHIVPFQIRYHVIWQKTAKYLFFITNSIALIFNVADIPYYPFTLKRTTFSIFSQFKNEENMPLLLFRFLFDYWHITLFFIGTIVLMVYVYNKIGYPKHTLQRKWSYYLTAILMFPVVGLACLAGIRGDLRHSTRPMTMSNAGVYVNEPKETNIVLNTPFCIIQTVVVKNLSKVSYFKDYNEASQYYSPLHVADTTKTLSNKKNVVIIILESFGRENIGFLNPDSTGKYKGYTPFLDSLCEHSLVFWNAYANGRKSIDALPSVLASIPSVKEPFVLTEFYGNTFSALPKLLGEQGYHTSFFHGAPNGSMGYTSFVNIAGVKHYFGKDEYNNDDDFDGYWGIWDEPFFQFFGQKLATFPQPFLSTIFSVSSHHPFVLPRKYQDVFISDTHPIQKTIRYTDWSLRRFFDTVKQSEWYDNTLFVITADHCNTEPQTASSRTSAGVFSIPIIFYEPNGNLQGIRYNVAQQTDIMPTVLSYLRYDKPYFAFGDDIFNPKKEHFLLNFSDGNCQLYYNDYFFQFDGTTAKGLYNIKNDILLKNNILSQYPDTVNYLTLRAKAFIQQYNNRMLENKLTY